MTNGNAKSAAFRRVAEDVLALTAGLGAGAGLMYLYDPRRGRARRRRIIERTTGLLHRDESRIEKTGKDLLNRMRGVLADTATALSSEAHVPDETLVERVRSKIGHILENPHEVQVSARSGVVTIEGKLGHAQRRQLREEISAIPGVKRIEGHLAHRLAFNPALLAGLAAGLALLKKTP